MQDFYDKIGPNEMQKKQCQQAASKALAKSGATSRLLSRLSRRVLYVRVYVYLSLAAEGCRITDASPGAKSPSEAFSLRFQTRNVTQTAIAFTHV